MDGDLHTISKAIIAAVLTTGVPCPPTLALVEVGDDATIIIEGQAQMVAIGKPNGISTFGDLSDLFQSTILRAGGSFDRTDIAFHKYCSLNKVRNKTEACQRSKTNTEDCWTPRSVVAIWLEQVPSTGREQDRFGKNHLRADCWLRTWQNNHSSQWVKGMLYGKSYFFYLLTQLTEIWTQCL